VTLAQFELDQAVILIPRLAGQLRARVNNGDEAALPAYLATMRTLTAVLEHVSPGQQLLTTRQMAERLGIQPKALLRRKARGVVKPALQKGKLIRWKADGVSGR
jgi:hypothetical protein